MFSRESCKDPEQKQHMEIMSLHGYYIHTTLMKKRYEEELLKGDHVVTEYDDPAMNIIVTGLKLGAMPVGTYMEYWYGGLFAVCEGCQELRLTDEVLDKLLDDPKLETLRRFRNAAFHFQRDYLSSKKTEFIEADGSVAYIRELSKEFGRWFRDYIPARFTAT